MSKRAYSDVKASLPRRHRMSLQTRVKLVVDNTIENRLGRHTCEAKKKT
jgi:hypothetical protein